jgi:hypothetical protein
LPAQIDGIKQTILYYSLIMGNASSNEQHPLEVTNGNGTIAAADNSETVEAQDEKKADDHDDYTHGPSSSDPQQSSTIETEETILIPIADTVSWMVGDENGNATNQSDRLDLLKQSYRSFKSSEGSISITTPVTSSVHGNLMRSYINRDPMKYVH